MTLVRAIAISRCLLISFASLFKISYYCHSLEYHETNNGYEENEDEERNIQNVKSAINTLSFSELEAIIHIFDELQGEEGILVASRIADRVGITRSVIVNALRKFESAGIIESRSSGMKGTYIKILNPAIFDELKQIRLKKQ